MDEQPRPDANTDERAYTLTIDESLSLYQRAGHARIPRALQKYCARGDLDCIKEETEYGQRYRITPASVGRHLEQIEQLRQANMRDRTRPDATVRQLEIKSEREKNDRPNIPEHSRPDANNERYIEQLEKRLDEKDGEIAFLRAEVAVKNEQIREQTERAKETNVLIQGLQRMLGPLLSAPSDRESEQTNEEY